MIISRGSYFGITHVGAEQIIPAGLGANPNAGFHFGSALLAADFDQDGYDDLAIGGYNDAAMPGPIQSGQVFLAYGGATVGDMTFEVRNGSR